MSNDTDARDIVARAEDALRRRDMLLEHRVLQEAVREMRATRAERDALRAALAQRITTSGAPPVVDMTHYVPLDINVLRGNAAPEPPPRETGAERDEAWRGIGE